MQRSAGVGFPGLVVVSLAALLALLGGGALLSLRPWEAESVEPHLTAGPKAAVGGAVALRRSARPVSGAAGAAAPEGASVAGSSAFAAARPSPAAGVSSNRPVTVTAAAPVPPPPQESPAATQPPPPRTVAVTVPVAAPVSAAPPTEPAPAPSSAPRTEAVSAGPGGLSPRTAMAGGRDVTDYSVVRLDGDESQAELALGEGEAGGFQVHEGGEYALSFSFYIETMAYGAPGAPNLIMALQSDAAAVPAFGLQLLEQPTASGAAGEERGLWSSGEAMGGDRFLSPVEERAWHDVVVRFRASSRGDGFYEVLLDGRTVDARSGVDLISPGSNSAQIELGLFRDGELVQGTSELRLGGVGLGDSLESVLP